MKMQSDQTGHSSSTVSSAERRLVDRWLATYEPAADIVVLDREVKARSKRHPVTAAVARTSDLLDDLSRVLGKLVDAMG